MTWHVACDFGGKGACDASFTDKQTTADFIATMRCKMFGDRVDYLTVYRDGVVIPPAEWPGT